MRRVMTYPVILLQAELRQMPSVEGFPRPVRLRLLQAGE